jgi:hypothetical protein
MTATIATIASRPSRATAEVVVRPPLVGRAAVVGVRATGMSLHDRPVVDLELHIALDLVGPYRITVRRAVPQELVLQLRPGASVPVLIDAADGRRIDIRWEDLRDQPLLAAC